MCPFVERLFSSSTAHSQIVAQQRPTPKCTIAVGQRVAFFIQCFFFSICSLDATLKCILLCLDFVTAQAIIPQLATSDSVSNTYRMPRVV